MFKKSLIVFSVLIMGSFWASAHKFYTSLTQVEYNSTNRTAEVIMNLYTDDLEKALSEKFGRKVTSLDKDFNPLCYQYLDSKFQVKDAKNHPLKNEYVGIELKREMVSVFLEVKLAQGLNQAHIKQVSLLDTYSDQTNIVNIKSGKNKTSLVFKAGSPDLQRVNWGSWFAGTSTASPLYYFWLAQGLHPLVFAGEIGLSNNSLSNWRFKKVNE